MEIDNEREKQNQIFLQLSNKYVTQETDDFKKQFDWLIQGIFNPLILLKSYLKSKEAYSNKLFIQIIKEIYTFQVKQI